MDATAVQKVLTDAPLALVDAWIRGDLRCSADALGTAIIQYAHPVIDVIFEPDTD